MRLLVLQRAPSSRWVPGRLLQFAAFQSGPVALAATALLVWPILGRLMEPSDIGRISGALAVASIAAPACTFGVHQHVPNLIARHGSRTKAVRELAISRVAALLWTVVSLLAAAVSGVSGSPAAATAAVVAAAASSIIVAGTARGAADPCWYAIATVVVQIGGLLALGLTFAETRSLSLATVAYASVLAVPAFVQALRYSGPLRVPRPFLHGVLQSSLGLVPHLVLAVALMMAMRLLVQVERGNAALGHYQYAALLIGAVTTLASSLDAQWSTAAQGMGTAAGVDQYLRRKQQHLQAFLLATCALVALFGMVALPLWLPEGYDVRPIRVALACALPAAALQAVADMLSARAMWAGQNRVVSGATAISVAIALVFAAFAIESVGWEMAGLAITVGAGSRTFALAVLSRSRLARILSRRSQALVLAQTFVAALFLVSSIGTGA